MKDFNPYRYVQHGLPNWKKTCLGNLTRRLQRPFVTHRMVQ